MRKKQTYKVFDVERNFNEVKNSYHYMILPILKKPWVDNIMDFILGLPQ